MQIYLANLKRMVQGSVTAGKNCIDVFVRNTIADPLFVTGISASGIEIRETRAHDSGSIAIPNASFVEIGTMVQGGASAVIGGSDIFKIKISTTIGEPLVIRNAASAAAALAQGAAGNIALVNRGQSLDVDVDLTAGDRLWVMSLDAAASDGYLFLNLIG